MISELTPHNSQKSYYGKAIIESTSESIKLYSYGTFVAQIVNNRAMVYGTYSATTLKHIKSFLKQHGFKADSKSQILKDYGIR